MKLLGFYVLCSLFSFVFSNELIRVCKSYVLQTHEQNKEKYSSTTIKYIGKYQQVKGDKGCVGKSGFKGDKGKTGISGQTGQKGEITQTNQTKINKLKFIIKGRY